MVILCCWSFIDIIKLLLLVDVNKAITTGMEFAIFSVILLH